jgi:hypothetical protein
MPSNKIFCSGKWSTSQNINTNKVLFDKDSMFLSMKFYIFAIKIIYKITSPKIHGILSNIISNILNNECLSFK